jgi:hypothetical protein
MLPALASRISFDLASLAQISFFHCYHDSCGSIKDTRLQVPKKWHKYKEGKAGNKSRQRHSLLVFSELPCLSSAGSPSGCFHISLGCKPRSLLWVSLGWFDYSKDVRKDNRTPAYSPVSDRRRFTALVEVHWARRAQAPMPPISELNSWIVFTLNSLKIAAGNDIQGTRMYFLKSLKAKAIPRCCT